MSKDKRQLRAEAVERLWKLKLKKTSYNWDDVIEAMLAERDPRYTVVSQLIDLLTDDERPDTFHDDFYDCESTVDAGEDTREKLEEYIRWRFPVLEELVIECIDRQSSITERECREYEDAMRKQHHKRIAELKAERDELREKYNDLLEYHTKVDCDCDCCNWQAERDKLQAKLALIRLVIDE